MGEQVIVLTDLTKQTTGNFTAVDHIRPAYSQKRRNYSELLGPNGAEKSTYHFND